MRPSGPDGLSQAKHKWLPVAHASQIKAPSGSRDKPMQKIWKLEKQPPSQQTRRPDSPQIPQRSAD